MSNVKYLSEIEKYEIINVNDGEKYETLANNDIIVDEKGELKLLLLNVGGGKFGFFGGASEFYEVDWEYVKKIGARTIILDAEQELMRKVNL
ncbi:YlmC/YmxH family sporulation protein [uncultured Clostridium sp.]|jgi:YlmC/YmxH family sporulation protein|uniref:YlmC/YmxH family sporulation protein n=1 Tax=uncultured Clostridium sp. TaxID=59620 RepID=UPI002609F48D|nr:YlmC/YmxH family sporulation protein [uncultured Clostridium sp.]